MSRHETWKKQHIERLAALMGQSTALRNRQVVDGALTAGQLMISEWQTRRLDLTYADMTRLRRYRSAVEFFKSDLYGAKDFTQRDTDFERVYPLMVKFLTDGALVSVITAMELQTLTQKLDIDMVETLTGKLGVDPAAGADGLDPDTYAEAYRVLDNEAERVRQIELAYRAGEILDEVVKKKIVYQTVRLARKPAQVAGLGELQDFIERGLAAFKRLRGAGPFLDTIRQRETFIVEQIFSGEPAGAWYGPDVFDPMDG